MKRLLIAAILLGAAPAFAQNPLTTTKSPPAGGSSESTVNTTNSLPPAAGTERPTNQPGAAVGQTSVPSSGGTTTAPAR